MQVRAAPKLAAHWTISAGSLCQTIRDNPNEQLLCECLPIRIYNRSYLRSHHSRRLPYSQSWADMRSCTQRQCMNGTHGNATLQQKDYANMLYVHLDRYAKAARVPQKRHMMKPDVVPRGHTVHCNMRHQHCKGSCAGRVMAAWSRVVHATGASRQRSLQRHGSTMGVTSCPPAERHAEQIIREHESAAHIKAWSIYSRGKRGCSGGVASPQRRTCEV